VILGAGGIVEGLEVEHDGERSRIPATGAVIRPTRASAA
jgi:hypothetical protein